MIVTRLSLGYLKSARAQREQYIGPWLPEPLLTADADPELAAVERRETLATAFLVLLESLNPHERAVFLLREVFEYSYDEIGSMLGLSSANCRQIFHRAQAHVAERRPRFEPSPAEQRRLVDRFIQACQRGDMAALTDVLAGDVVAWSDGGGKATLALQPVYGREKVLRFLAGLLGKAPAGSPSHQRL
ncbi:MAG: sigma factor-like helix-turn-helix DNA-binding protein [Kouleothrix sp.]